MRQLEGRDVIVLKSRPTFEISESKDGGYLVLVTWPEGPEQQLNGFGSVEAAAPESKKMAQTRSLAALAPIESCSPWREHVVSAEGETPS
jgi:hypothetical protein